MPPQVGGLARAKAYEQQVKALGQTPTAIVNAITALADKQIKVVPEILVAGGGGSLDGLAGTLMGWLHKGGLGGIMQPPTPEAPTQPAPPAVVAPGEISYPKPPENPEESMPA